MPTPAIAEDRARFPSAVGLAAALGAVLFVAALQWQNPRLVPSWHGFLHSAIAERAPISVFTPENPFFAGETLPYYWVYHRLAGELSSAAGVSSLAALHGMALVSLALLVLCAVGVGVHLTGRAAAGLLVAFLALAGANPLGPIVAALHAAGGQPLMHDATIGQEMVFVSDTAADRMMSRPLLGALYFGSDWRNGQNLVWFWDISSRAPALAALMAAVWALMAGRPWMLALASLVVTAMNPVIGLAVSGCLGFALMLSGRAEGRPGSLALCGSLVAGAALATPSFLHLLSYSGATGLSGGRWILLKSVYLALNYGPLTLLAVAGGWGAPAATRGRVRAVMLAGVILLGLAICLALAEGNEHNLANAAGILLAVPSGAAPWYLGRLIGPGGSTRAATIVVLAFLPMTVGTCVAFSGRPSLPFRYLVRLERTPADQPAARVEAWLRGHTPLDAVLIANPDRPIKMSGNVSELPAFTGRALFVDQPSYLTTPYGEAFEVRRRVARELLRGDSPSADSERLMQALDRPIYLVATEPAAIRALEPRYGPPAFAADGFAVFGPLPWPNRDAPSGDVRPSRSPRQAAPVGSAAISLPFNGLLAGKSAKSRSRAASF